MLDSFFQSVAMSIKCSQFRYRAMSQKNRVLSKLKFVFDCKAPPPPPPLPAHQKKSRKAVKMEIDLTAVHDLNTRLWRKVLTKTRFLLI